MVKIFSPYYPKKYTVAEHSIMLDHCILLCDTKLYLEYQDMEITLTGILLRSIPTWTDPFFIKKIRVIECSGTVELAVRCFTWCNGISIENMQCTNIIVQ